MSAAPFIFFPGLHQPADADKGDFDRACISINRLRGRRKPIACGEVLIDGAAFTELALHGAYRHDVEVYARELRRLHDEGVVKIAAAVSQDFMCEAFMLAKTGLTIEDHQRLTIERYDALAAFGLPFPIMPVLQGYAPADYAHHLEMYGDRLTPGMWVGVGSVCKRNGQPERIVEVLHAIKSIRPDLRLHGFGVKKTSLLHPGVRELLFSADSMAWSFSARKQGRNGNDWREARTFTETVIAVAEAAFRPWQMPLLRIRVDRWPTLAVGAIARAALSPSNRMVRARAHHFAARAASPALRRVGGVGMPTSGVSSLTCRAPSGCPALSGAP